MWVKGVLKWENKEGTEKPVTFPLGESLLHVLKNCYEVKYKPCPHFTLNLHYSYDIVNAHTGIYLICT